ncbi:MAG: dihydrofolate reductase [Holosporales bacterium]|jgi:dihydrofolate reductase|nr:dihydrofolate reductase [Holosporales bacterium]
MAALIAIVDKSWGVAKKNAIPWSFPEDRAFFHQKTYHAAVIMGRKTFLTLPRHAFLKKTLVVLSRSCSYLPGANVFSTLEEALVRYPDAWIIGGAMVYNEALSQRYVDRLYLTRMHLSYDADCFLKTALLEAFSLYVLRSTPQADFLLGLGNNAP